ncbi:MAG: hypothetical protein GX133_06000 [Syntrophomonadaceae bacterium]|nr:hypothetical protein [Syntrophomonadaceae bacterium]
MENNSGVDLNQTFHSIENSIERMWLMWHANLGNLNFLREKFEGMARSQLEQNSAAWKEWIQLVEDLGQQTRRNQEQFQRMVQEAVEEAVQASDQYQFNPNNIFRFHS